MCSTIDMRTHGKLVSFINRNATFLFQKPGSPDVTDLHPLYVPPMARTYIRMANRPWHRRSGRAHITSRIISIIHTQRSLFFSPVHTRFVLCLRKGIYLWKRAISKTLRSAEWLKGASRCNKKIRKKYIK